MTRIKKIHRKREVGRHDAHRSAIEEIYLAGIGKVLARAKSEVLRKIHKGSGKASFLNAQFANTTPVAADFLFDLDAFADAFFVEMREAAEEGLQISGQGLLSELGIDEKYITPHGIIHDFVNDRQNKLANVPQEIYDEVKTSLNEGMQGGETMDELAARVQETFGSIHRGRAMVVARTETNSVYNTGRMDSMKHAGFTHKSWLTAHDERVRTSHHEAEAQGPVPIDGTFSNGLTMPGDPQGPPGEVISCRCVLQTADAPEDEAANV